MLNINDDNFKPKKCRPTTVRPGGPSKVAIMATRANSGLELFHEGDNDNQGVIGGHCVRNDFRGYGR